jgi:hypothetical protein
LGSFKDLSKQGQTAGNGYVLYYVMISFKLTVSQVNRRDGFSIKKSFRLSARGASFLTKQASNENVVQVV